MPSFSLMCQFGKQHKATIASPVSSGLVEQHVSPTMAESSDSQTRQPSEAGNVFSSTRAANSHGLTAGLVALSQHMEGVSIRDIKGPVMSNNQVNIHHYYRLQANFDDSDAMLRVGDIYLEEEVGSYVDQNNVWRTRYKGQIMASSASNMSIWTYRGEKAAEVNSLSHFILPANYLRHLKKFTKNMHHCLALVFHGAPYFMDRRDYYNCSINKMSMLEAHNLHGWPLCISDVDETGKLVIAHFIPGSTDRSAFDPRICMAFETSTFIKEDLLAYYKFPFEMVFLSVYDDTSTATLPSPLDKAAPFQLSHPDINLPVYSIPSWNKVVNGMDITMGQTGIVLTLLPNMTIRLFEQDDEALFATWACQANRLIQDLPINIMDLQTGKLSIPDWKKDTGSPRLNNLLETEHLYLFCPLKGAGNINWSHDKQGQHVIEDSSIQAAFGITVQCAWDTYVYPTLPQLYQILQTIHEGCGFNPYGTQIAEYLGLPLAVIDNGHSELQECMEDPEESESGDSDYVSASEDA
ncbi:hypothetical protein C8J56DRAFT_890556 [Mycena floridula]|nr:hypothetical protein C8J56DRAFT_890556 [Mycena floridula]